MQNIYNAQNTFLWNTEEKAKNVRIVGVDVQLGEPVLEAYKETLPCESCWSVDMTRNCDISASQRFI